MTDDYTIDTITRDGYTGTIWIDSFPENPREFYEHPGTLVVQLNEARCSAPSREDRNDGRYEAVITAAGRAYYRGLDEYEFVERYAKAYLDAAAVKFWDDPRGPGRLVCIADRDAGFEHPEQMCESTLNEYAGYVTGDVYGITVTDPEGNEIDSCGGYYGDEQLPYLRESIEDDIRSSLALRHIQRTSMYRRLVG